MLEAKPVVDRDVVEHALVAVLAMSSWCRMAFRKDKHGVVNAVPLLDLATSGLGRSLIKMINHFTR
jgi:hypothetical protein